MPNTESGYVKLIKRRQDFLSLKYIDPSTGMPSCEHGSAVPTLVVDIFPTINQIRDPEKEKGKAEQAQGHSAMMGRKSQQSAIVDSRGIVGTQSDTISQKTC